MSLKFTLILLAGLVMLAGCTTMRNELGTTPTTAETSAPEATKAETTTTTEVAAVVTSVQTILTAVSTTENIATTEETAASSTTLAGWCANDRDCPPAANSSRYCWTGQDTWNGDDKKVYVDQISYVCSGNGTENARCAESRIRIPIDRCIASNCFNGGCYPTHCFNGRIDGTEENRDCGGECPDCSLVSNVTCMSDCDCLSRTAQVEGRYYHACESGETMAGELAAEGRCYEHDVYQNLVAYKCLKPGTAKSSCTSTVLQDMMTASCRDKNCTLDCDFRAMPYANLALLENKTVYFTSIG